MVLIVCIALIGALIVIWLMRRPITTEDQRYWQENDYWSGRDDIEDKGLETRLVDRTTSAAAYDVAIQRVGPNGDVTAEYFNVLREWGY